MKLYSFYKKVAIIVLGLMVYQMFFPVVAYALTTGPTQPENSQWAPIGADNMVDLFSGDFTYNIPLFEIRHTIAVRTDDVVCRPTEQANPVAAVPSCSPTTP